MCILLPDKIPKMKNSVTAFNRVEDAYNKKYLFWEWGG